MNFPFIQLVSFCIFRLARLASKHLNYNYSSLTLAYATRHIKERTEKSFCVSLKLKFAFSLPLSSHGISNEMRNKMINCILSTNEQRERKYSFDFEEINSPCKLLESWRRNFETEKNAETTF